VMAQVAAITMETTHEVDIGYQGLITIFVRW
jgi:hypothetical protein